MNTQNMYIRLLFIFKNYYNNYRSLNNCNGNIKHGLTIPHSFHWKGVTTKHFLIKKTVLNKEEILRI